MKAQNYYEILGVSRDASEDQIQRAYRKLARKYHPDVSKDKDADKKFKELSEARDVLKDQEKRKLYDTYGANWQQEKDRPRSQHRYGSQDAPGSSGYSQSFHFPGNDFGESVDLLQRAVAANPRHVRSYYYLSLAYSGQPVAEPWPPRSVAMAALSIFFQFIHAL